MAVDSKRIIKVGNDSYTIKERHNGTLEVKLWNDNIKKQVSVYAKTETELKRKIRDRKKELLSEKIIETNMTTEQYFFTWLYNYRYNTVKAPTFDKNEQMIKEFIVPTKGKKKFKSLEGIDAQEILNYVSGVRAYSTVKKVKEVMNLCFRHAYIKGDIEKNPMELVNMPKEEYCAKETKQIEFYTDNDINLMISAIIRCYEENKWYRISPIFIFIANTGLRIGEALALNKSDIDYKNRYISVNKTISRVKERDNNDLKKYKYRYIITSPKTKSSKRKVELNKSALWAIKEIEKRNLAENVVESDYVFSSELGNFFNPRSIEDTFKRVCRQSELPYYGLHSLRHTFASRCFNKGVSVEVVSKILGHSTPSITSNIYIHIMPQHRRDAVNCLDEDIILNSVS